MHERVLVVGAGSISNAWLPLLVREELTVTGIVDLDEDRARSQARAYGLDVPTSTSLAPMLRADPPDFVLDLTVPSAHCDVTCAALRAGCHVVGEKPMADTLDDARRMVRTAEETGRCYLVSQSRRWEPHHQRIRAALASGALGPVTTVNCDFYIGAHFGGFRDEMPSPLIMDMAIHHFDLVRCLTGADPVAVYAHEFNPRGSWYRGAAAAVCIFEMTGGIVFCYRGSWCAEGCHTDWHGNWRITGERGTILYEQGREPWGQVVASDEPAFHKPLRDADLPPVEVPWTGFHGGLRQMLAFLRDGAPPDTECHDNIKSLAMVFAAIESARHQRRIPVTI